MNRKSQEYLLNSLVIVYGFTYVPFVVKIPELRYLCIFYPFLNLGGGIVAAQWMEKIQSKRKAATYTHL